MSTTDPNTPFNPTPQPGFPPAAPNGQPAYPADPNSQPPAAAPYGQQPAYAAAPYGQPVAYVTAPQSNGLAIGGMVCGIVGLVFCWTTIFFGLWAALVGVILGALGVSRASKLGGQGKPMAIAGLICGGLGVVIVVILFIAVGSMFASATR